MSFYNSCIPFDNDSCKRNLHNIAEGSITLPGGTVVSLVTAAGERERKYIQRSIGIRLGYGAENCMHAYGVCFGRFNE